MKNVSCLFLKFLIFIIMMSVLVCDANEIDCDNMQISIDIEETQIVVVVAPAFCSFIYIVIHYVQCIEVSRVSLPQPIATTTFQRHINSRNRIAVQLPGSAETVAYRDFVDGIEGNSSVENLQFSIANKRFEWEPPADLDACDLEYIVNFSNEIMEEEILTKDQFYEFPLYPCTHNFITVTTMIMFDNTMGEFASTMHLISPAREPPVELSTIPGINNATIVWEIIDDPKNICQIDVMFFELRNKAGETTKFVTDINPIITFDLQPLQPNSTYVYRACFIMVLLNTWICSDNVTFTTLPEPNLGGGLWVDQTQGHFIVHWSPRSDHIILGHTLRIQPIGPLHFVPVDCDFNLHSVERTFNGSDITSYNFTGSVPSFNYSVLLVTHYLEIKYAEEIFVTTNESTPGDLAIQTSYQGTPSSPYDVTLRVGWKIPCNVNGRVQRFIYTVTGTLNRRSSAVCRDIVLSSGSIDLVEGQSTYNVFVPDIIPFFNYTLSVTTMLALHSGTKIMDLGAAPPAYTSSNWQCSTWVY